MKIMFLDLETTGTHPYKNGVIQISGSIRINNDNKENFNYLVRPFKKDVIDEEALKITDKTEMEIMAYPEPNVVYAKFIDMLSKYVDRYDKKDKFVVCGYNASFDCDFLRSFFTKNNDKYFGSWFWHPPMCMMYASMLLLAKERKGMENFKLMTVAEHLGIKTDDKKAHDASYDIDITEKIYDIIVNKIKL